MVANRGGVSPTWRRSMDFKTVDSEIWIFNGADSLAQDENLFVGLLTGSVFLSQTKLQGTGGAFWEKGIRGGGVPW